MFPASAVPPRTEPVAGLFRALVALDEASKHLPSEKIDRVE
jgi:hypothetical protein